MLHKLFLTLHEVLAFSCPVPGRVIQGVQKNGNRTLACYRQGRREGGGTRGNYPGAGPKGAPG